MSDSVPQLGVLQRALSLRPKAGGSLVGEAAGGRETVRHEIDNKRLLPHVTESSSHECVAVSSPRALASALQQSKVNA